MRKIFLILIVAFSLSLQAQTVKIGAAANLRFVLNEIKTNYARANPNVNIVVNFGSSGALLQQILNGAGYDIFMSADNLFPEKLKEQGGSLGDVKAYARGRLVLWSNTIDVSKGMESLASEAVKRIAIANPAKAPYGDRAIECLKSAGLYDKVKDKIIYADNISQTAQFIQTGNAEAGFLAMSLVVTPEMKGSVYVIDPKMYQVIEQSMVLVKGRKSNPEAAGFMKFVLSDSCKSIFEKYGYIVP